MAPPFKGCPEATASIASRSYATVNTSFMKPKECLCLWYEEIQWLGMLVGWCIRAPIVVVSQKVKAHFSWHLAVSNVTVV